MQRESVFGGKQGYEKWDHRNVVSDLKHVRNIAQIVQTMYRGKKKVLSYYVFN